MSRLSGRRVLLGVCGSVAAFKAAALASLLSKEGAEVRVVLTDAGSHFVTTETFRDLTNSPVFTSLWGNQVDHIELASWPGLVVVAPATADLIAKAALGLADDLLSTVLLATQSPLLFAPAMESNMWRHPATQSNVETLTKRGACFVGPVEGRLASGGQGSGRMVEALEIAGAAAQILSTEPSDGTLTGLRILITAGPTQEPIDPVRFISNRSSGKMGYSIAQALARRGALVRIVSGPVDEAVRNSVTSHVEVVPVMTADEMAQAVTSVASDFDVIIMAAAVADFRPAVSYQQKVKKSAASPSLELEPTVDILSQLSRSAPTPLLVGFAAETEDILANARSKLETKGLSMIVANDVSGREGPIFGSDDTTVTFLLPDREPLSLPRMSKGEVAEEIADLIPDLLRGRAVLPE